jgi:putative SOS response-associated peptidase YedK
MCGRFTQHYTWHEIHDLYGLVGAARNLEPRYNIAPTTTIDVVMPSVDGPSLVPMRWGLIPSWWKKTAKEVPSTFNARAESVAEKPMFRSAFKRNRCIIPASGYFEWKTMRDGKQPYYIRAADGGVLSIAGLWDRWQSTGGDEAVLSCTMIITDANAYTRPIDNRMPVLLDRAAFGPWLTGTAGTDFLKVAPDKRIRMWSVSRRMNRTGGEDDPALTAEIAA